MARPNFFNDNQGRTFPLVQHFQEELEVSESSLSAPMIFSMLNLPNSALVDFGATLGVQAYYTEATHVVYLSAVKRQGDLFIFEFRSTAPGLTDSVLSFSRSVTSTAYEVEYVDATPLDSEASASESTCVDDPAWSGYLATGTMEDLRLVLDNDGDKLKGDENGALVEPALIQNMSELYARSINLANADRTRAENPDNCIPLQWSFDSQAHYVTQVCLTGPVRFVEGFNTVITQDTPGNRIIIGAEVGAGQGEPCDEVPLFTGETAPAGAVRLTGGPGCNELIRSINGIGGRRVAIAGGNGVTVEPDPANHRVIVDINFADLAVCYDGIDPEESDCSETSQSLCGPA